MDALAQRLALQLDFLKLYTQVRTRPWGLLLYKLENPDYHEANGARYVRCHADESAAVIDEIVRFYRTRRLTDDLIGLRNAVRTAIIVTNAAWQNKVSMGCHYRE